MSRKQRRDHRPDPTVYYVPHPQYPGGTIIGGATCKVCGERLSRVLGTGVPDHWRHWRRHVD